MARSLRMNGEAVKDSRLANGEIADVYHLLHFSFAFGENRAGFECDELTELVFELAERVSKATNRIPANRSRGFAPFLERFQRARDRLVVIVLACLSNAR